MPPTRRYICLFCAKSFLRLEHKARHERSHTNEKPFLCSICFAKFVRRDLLQRHLRTVHNEHDTARHIKPSTNNNNSQNDVSILNNIQESIVQNDILPKSIPHLDQNEPSNNGLSDDSQSSSHTTPLPLPHVSSPSSPQFNGLPHVFDNLTHLLRNGLHKDFLAGAYSNSNYLSDQIPSINNNNNNNNNNNITTENSPGPVDLQSSNIISSNFYSLSERNLILLLALSRRFTCLDIINGEIKSCTPLENSSSISNYLMIWGTVSNIKLPVVLNLNKLLTIPTVHESKEGYTVFDLPLFYSVLAFGAAEFGQFNDCIKLFNKSWSMILANISLTEEIIEPLTILAYISFNYLQELFYFTLEDIENTNNNNKILSNSINNNEIKNEVGNVSIHTIFHCLDDVIYKLVSDNFTSYRQTAKSFQGSVSLSTINYYRSHGLPLPPDLLSQETSAINGSSAGRERFNYWYTYNLLLAYSLNFGKAPPQIHRIFLNKILPTSNDYHMMAPPSRTGTAPDSAKNLDYLVNETLKKALDTLSQSPSLLKNFTCSNSLTSPVFPANTFKNLTLRESCIIMGLSNELQTMKNDMNLSSTKNSLHNAIIMANKSLNVNSNYQQFSTKGNNVGASRSSKEYTLYMNSPYLSTSNQASVTYSKNVSTFGSKSHGVHSPNEPNLNIVNNTVINLDSNYLFNVNNFLNMLVNNNINQDLINLYNLIIILKKRILIRCDNKLLLDLLIDYIIIPNHELYWNLMHITIKEFTFINGEFTSLDDKTIQNKYQEKYVAQKLHGSASFSNGAYGILTYTNHVSTRDFTGFAELTHEIMRSSGSLEIVVDKMCQFIVGGSDKESPDSFTAPIINNNLGLTTLPLLFIGYLISLLSPKSKFNFSNNNNNNSSSFSADDAILKFLRFNAGGSSSNSNLVFLRYFLKLPKNFFSLVIEVFLVVLKIFYGLRNDSSLTATSPILHAIAYIIQEMGCSLTNDMFLLNKGISPKDVVNKAKATSSSFSSSLSSSTKNYIPKDDEVIYFYLRNIEFIFTTWLDFLNFGNSDLNLEENYLIRLKACLSKCMEKVYQGLDIGNDKSNVSMENSNISTKINANMQLPNNLSFSTSSFNTDSTSYSKTAPTRVTSGTKRTWSEASLEAGTENTTPTSTKPLLSPAIPGKSSNLDVENNDETNNNKAMNNNDSTVAITSSNDNNNNNNNETETKKKHSISMLLS